MPAAEPQLLTWMVAGVAGYEIFQDLAKTEVGKSRIWHADMSCSSLPDHAPGHNYEVIAGLWHTTQAHDLHGLTWQRLF